MSEIHRMHESKLSEFFEMVDWSFIKRVEISKTVDGVIWAKLVHHRPGKYMLHGLKHGWKNGNGLNETRAELADIARLESLEEQPRAATAVRDERR